jgi:hypothetical protein
VIFEMLTVQRAFKGKSESALLRAVLDGEVPDLKARLDKAGISQEVQRVLQKALSPTREDRYDSCAELGAALAQAVPARDAVSQRKEVAALVRVALANSQAGPTKSTGSSLEQLREVQERLEALTVRMEKTPSLEGALGGAPALGDDDATKTHVVDRSKKPALASASRIPVGIGKDFLKAPTGNLLERYLSLLPDGENSHPDCLAKGSMITNILESRAPDFDLDLLPPKVKQMVECPPGFSEWVPYVYMQILTLAYGDFIFKTNGEMVNFIYEMSKRLIRKPAYRVMLFVVSPTRLLGATSQRFNVFQRGLDLTLLESSKKHAILRLEYPEHIFSMEAQAGCQSVALLSAVEAAGAKNVHWEIAEFSPNHTIMAYEWE